MSGHSKWASIKHKKAVVDSRRGKLFTKLARAITTAARDGGGELEGNPALQLAVQKARDASMPKDNIERAIAKGTGAGADAAAIEDVMYEGYAPGGVALLIEAMTENRNRTGADVRHLLSKHGGSLGEPGSVSYLFDKRGLILVDADRYDEDDLMPAIEAGAEDIAAEAGIFEITTEPTDLTAVRAALEEAEIELQSAELAWLPKARVPVAEDDAAKLMRLIDALEENDDIDAVHANFDIDAEVLERVAG
ncbi:MAG TPA: YebC/PmpR family DNA-binding transcriptional regulator [Solirubrobacteraceae bacterium]|nr:YebC/PmpR family DNA-binding transcriptional regulator [Solirubrobacteraceae bacterium]